MIVERFFLLNSRPKLEPRIKEQGFNKLFKCSEANEKDMKQAAVLARQFETLSQKMIHGKKKI